jgi:GntR family transcriptional regulator, rspAB operon transcriptional repressor
MTIPIARETRVKRPPRLADLVYDEMKKAIINAEFERERFYSEQELATLFGVSRAPVRDATIRLSNEGLILVRSNRGMRVVELSAPAIAECYEMREVLECWVVRKLAKQATDHQRALITDNLDDQRRIVAASDSETWVAANAAFHLLLAEAAGNSRIARSIEGIGDHMQRVGRTLIPKERPMRVIFDQHAAIVDAIMQRKPGEAERAMRYHLAETSRAYLTISK